MSTAKVSTRTGTAILMKTGLLKGNANLYMLNPPLEHGSFVVVSATTVGGNPETYIFPADEDGKVTGWGELDGSFRGDQDHKRALLGAGYGEIIEAAQ